VKTQLQQVSNNNMSSTAEVPNTNLRSMNDETYLKWSEVKWIVLRWSFLFTLFTSATKKIQASTLK
jgi:hypothetical protein